MIVFQSIKPKATAPITKDAWQAITIREMAEKMRDMDAAGVPVTPENLKIRGYDGDLVMRHGADAAHLARKLSTKQVI